MEAHGSNQNLDLPDVGGNRNRPEVGRKDLELIGAEPVGWPVQATESAPMRLPSRALVVDDSLVVADVVTALLRRTGWTVDVATSVEAALEHVHGVPYDLVVCDVCMPAGGGPAVYYAATTRRPDLINRFLFITGNVDDPEPWRFLAKIRAHVLEKPFTGRALRHALIKVIA